LGYWEIDEALVTLMSFSFAYVIATGFFQLVVGGAIAGGLSWLYGHYKKGAVRGKGKQLAYSLGLKEVRDLVPSNFRYFVGG
jgi:hypothetical protein